MKRLWFIMTVLIGLSGLSSGWIQAAQITDIADAADGKDPFDLYLDVRFTSLLNRSKITHEYYPQWYASGDINRPDYNELRFEEQNYRIDHMVEIGLYHDLALYVNLPWIIHNQRRISFVKGQNASGSTVYRSNPILDPHNPLAYPGNALSVDPSQNPSTKRAGIGDMQLGIKWAPFNDERDDTKSVWLIGFDWTIPSGKLAYPDDIVSTSDESQETGGVGLGHHILTPFMLFSHRYKVLEPYFGMHGSIPIQASAAKNAGLRIPYSGGFLTGMEIVPWEKKEKHQKFAIDLRLHTNFYSEVGSKGHSHSQGTVNELSDFLVSPSSNPNRSSRQLQAQDNFAQFGVNLGFVFQAAELIRFRMGVGLAHNSEHFITGADPCIDKNGDGTCEISADDVMNDYFSTIYDKPGFRLRVEETTLFNWWLSAMFTF